MKKNLLLTLSTIAFSSISFGQNVNIPNSTFKNYLVGNSAININSDTEIQVSEAQAFSGTINCGFFSINDLTGIEAFTALTGLICHTNQLTTLDLSANLALTSVRCNANQLTSLILGSNTALTELWCYDNQIASLDVSANTGLTNLYCQINNLSSIDVSSNSALVEFYCFNNQLTMLDLSPNTSLIKLHCNNNSLTSLKIDNGNNTNFIQVYTQANPNLDCIEVDNAAYSNSNWTGANFNFNFGTSFSEDCATFLSIEDYELISINIFPNPTSSLLNIEMKENSTIKIINLLGEIITIQQLAIGINILDLGYLTPGVYFIQSEQGLTHKFIKE
jgi:hypothetical protein